MASTDPHVLEQISKNVMKMGFMKRSAMQLDQIQKPQTNSIKISPLCNPATSRVPNSTAQSSSRVVTSGRAKFIKPESDSEDETNGEKTENAVAVVIKNDPDKPFIHPTVQSIDDPPDFTKYSPVLVEERFTILEELRFGRFSFQGQNPEVEKWMIYHECKRMGIEPPSDKELIDDMAEEKEEGEISEEEFEVCGQQQNFSKNLQSKDSRRKTANNVVNKSKQRNFGKKHQGKGFSKAQAKRRFGR